MARADLLLALVQSGAGDDELAFRRAAEALIAEEQAKKHSVLAGQLTQALARRRRTQGNVAALVRSEEAAALLHEIEPSRRLSDLVLPALARETVREIVEEHHRRDLLRSHGLEPRHRLLLVGPPGGGKTSMAEALATELMMPLLTVRYEGLIGSFLGETAGRMDTLFAAVRTRPCVLFFDEFDVVAKERGDLHETGEIKRVVSSLLLQVDRLPSYVVVVAATNHAELLDSAVWRRMQARLVLPAATRSGMVEWLQAWMMRTGLDLGVAPRTAAEKLRDISYAELEEFATDVQRRWVLGGGEVPAREITLRALTQWQGRANAALS